MSILDQSSDSFVGDIALALRAWARDPRLPLITLMLATVSALTGILSSISPYLSFVGILLLPVALFTTGYYGTQRIHYLRTFRSEPLSLDEIWRTSWRFLGRFFLLGLMAGVVLSPFFIAFYAIAFGGAMASRHPGETAAELQSHVQVWPAVLIFAVPLLVVDFALTFVTPALAYTTGSVQRALGIGLRMIPATVPKGLPYVLFPPLALQLVQYYPTAVGLSSRLLVAGSTVLVVMLNLVAKGATAAFYLRRNDVASSGSLAGGGTAPLSTAPTETGETIPA